MNKKFNLIFDLLLSVICLSFFIASCVLNKNFIMPLIGILILFSVMFFSYFPFIWNVPINYEKLNSDERNKVLKYMTIIICSFKFAIATLIIFYCIDKLFEIETILIVLLCITIVFCLILLIFTHKFLNLINKI